MKRFVILAMVLLLAACSGGGGTTPSPTDAPEPEITMAPEPPPDIEGLGVITFGKALDPDTLEVIEPNGKFKRKDPEIAWSAQFSEAAGATSVTVVIASVTQGGAETVILTEDVPISNPEFSLIGNAIDLASLVGNKAGTYVMRYLRDATLLAEGQFILVK